MNRRTFLSTAAVGAATLWVRPPNVFSFLQENSLTLTREQMEEFLLTAEIIDSEEIPIGITRAQRATLSDGVLRHDAQIQSIDEYHSSFTAANGVRELNFKDTYKFNIAAYLLDKILNLHMIPVSVDRKVRGKNSAVTWWIDDVLMSESARLKQGIPSPDPNSWNCQMYIVRAFDQLIYNTDRNLNNLMITKDWKIWMIDHTRAFRMMTSLRTPGDLVKCDRYLLAGLRRLTQTDLEDRLQPYLTSMEIRGLLGRRDRIVELFEKAAAASGEPAVLYDYLPRA